MMRQQLLVVASLAAAVLASQDNSNYIVGTNIGGWMVLEPWITPSLFYRFLGKKGEHDGQKSEVGMDSWTLCEALGPEEGNKLMRAHWDSWYTEQNIKDLADRNVTMVRLPIGDWTLDPYGPFVGCMDGAEDKIQWMFDTCAKHGIGILLDVHAVNGSQNGFDNGGRTNKLVWTDEDNFSHWPNQEANWMGQWSNAEWRYTEYYPENIARSVNVSEALLRRWGNHSAFAAFEPVNEPWWNSNGDMLKDFYREVRALMLDITPDAKFVFHNMFNFDHNWWQDLFPVDERHNVVMDHHYYVAWNDNMNTTQQYCDDIEMNAQNGAKESFGYEVWFGEWALATDVCAHWLGGFNDANKDPQFQCNWVDCPRSYLPAEFDTDFDRTAEMLGPYGTANRNNVCIQNGKCSSDSLFFSNEEVKTIGQCFINSFRKHIAGSFFWTAHNEIEPRWDYVRAYDQGWLRYEDSNNTQEELNFLQS